MRRAALFALVGLAFLLHWVLADPSFEVSGSQSDWSYVLGFSAAILLLAVALPVFARLARGRAVFGISLVPAAGAALSSAANVVEDGLLVESAFFVFVLGSAVLGLGLLSLAGVIAYTGRGGRRLLALVPVGTAAAIVLYVIVGGPLMLVVWLAAAAVAVAERRADDVLPA